MSIYVCIYAQLLREYDPNEIKRETADSLVLCR